jgi:carbon monoxide dehydrogenase subunit G
VGTWVASALVVAAASGCAAAAAGAGAATAVYLTDNGAETRIQASVDQAYNAAREAAQEMNIVVTETQSTSTPSAMPADTAKQDDGATKRELQGKAGDRDVNITIEQEGSLTKVEVTAKTSTVTWDKDFAKSLLEEIVEKASE